MLCDFHLSENIDGLRKSNMIISLERCKQPQQLLAEMKTAALQRRTPREGRHIVRDCSFFYVFPYNVILVLTVCMYYFDEKIYFFLNIHVAGY
jgi:hypothetical protein